MERQGDGVSAPDTVLDESASDARGPDDMVRADAAPLAEARPVGVGEREGQEYLLFWLGEWPCLVPLTDLREALPGTPHHAALPFSPRWLWGILPLRTDLAALVDPIPVLFNGPEVARTMDVTLARQSVPASDFGSAEAPRAVVVGEGDHLLALLVDRIGDICTLTEADQRAPALDSSPGAAPMTQYVTGAYAVASLERHALALQMARLTEDIFAALEERSAV